MTRYQALKESARQKAIEWQTAATETNLSYNDMIAQQTNLEAIARRCGLTREFQENGII